jgi:hypothetical protein
MEFGNCYNCKFRITFEEKYGKGFKHWGEQYGYSYVCQRFPPSKASYKDPHGRETIVKPADGCYEYQPRRVL